MISLCLAHHFAFDIPLLPHLCVGETHHPCYLFPVKGLVPLYCLLYRLSLPLTRNLYLSGCLATAQHRAVVVVYPYIEPVLRPLMPPPIPSLCRSLSYSCIHGSAKLEVCCRFQYCMRRPPKHVVMGSRLAARMR